MQNTHIADASSSYGSGPPTGRRLFKIRTGYFAGRMLAVFGRDANTLAISSAPPPYTSWSTPADIVTDAADYPFGAWMDDGGNLYVVYTLQSTEELRFVKVAFANAAWTPGTPATIYDADTNRHPSIIKDSYGRLWVSWSLLSGGNWTVRAKSSTDDGVTFGTGSSDPGAALSTDAIAAYSQLGQAGSFLHCFYTADGTSLSVRFRHIDNALWDSAQSLYSGTALSDQFAAAASADGRVLVAFLADGALHAKEYDGLAWSALHTVSSDDVTSPAVRYVNNRAFVFYAASIGTNQRQIVGRQRYRTGFDVERPVMPSFAPFGSILLYDADAGSAWTDQTAAAADTATADVTHSTSNALLEGIGDALYIGMSERFHLVSAILSTAGSGGAVDWQYWNGNGWTTFSPQSGAYAFDSSPAIVRLWDDLDSVPADWQKSAIHGATLYWIRAVVSTAYTIGPIGTQFTAVPKTESVSVLSP